jgi:transcription antitermination factor NusB
MEVRKRTRAREYALQILYQIDITGDPDDAVLNRFWNDSKSSPEIMSFATQLVKGTFEKVAEIDTLISKHSENWDLYRMAAIDRNIIRLAAYELLYRDDIPQKVTVNEAVDLAHKYSDMDSSRFINGVLDKLMSIEQRAES